MSTLITSSTYANIKTLSKEYKITNASPNPAKNKQVFRSQMQELTKKTPTQPNPLLSSRLRSWLLSLPLPSLYLIFSAQNGLICSFLIEMNLKIQCDGDFYFSLIENPGKKIQDFSLSSFFYMRKKKREENQMKEKEFESFLRFLDTEEYLDTVCLEQKSLRNPEKIIEIFEAITYQDAFKVPCLAHWDSASRKWSQEYPAWLKCSAFYSLSQWACAALEREIWLKFFLMNQIDPRAPGQVGDFLMESKVLASLEMVLVLAEFLRGLGQQRKEEIIGDHASASKIFEEIKGKLTRISESRTFESNKLFYAGRVDRGKDYQDPSCIDGLFIVMRDYSEEDLVEYMLCTPLVRTLTIYDLTLRIMSLKIKEKYTDKIVEELLKENTAQSSKPKKQKKKRKNKKKQKEDEKIETYTQSLVKNLMNQMYDFIKKNEEVVIEPQPIIDENEFKIVNQKKRNRKTQKEINKAVSASKKIGSRQVGKTPQSDLPEVQVRPEKILRSSWKTPGLLIQPSVDPIAFPPLHSISSQTSLHPEILHFVSSTSLSLSKKYQVLSEISEIIKNIVTQQLESTLFIYGSYATGLAVESSDIDLAVSCKETMTRAKVQNYCCSLSEILKNIHFFVNVFAITTASVPIVKVEADLSQFIGQSLLANIDITFVSSEEAEKSYIKMTDFVIEVQRTYPQIHPIAIVLKSFLYKQNLNSAYQGGLSSYGLVIWITAFLQSREIIEDLGLLLLEFLLFFASFDPKNTGVRILGDQSFFPVKLFNENSLTVDPANPENNVTRGSYNIGKVIESFGKFHKKLVEMKDRYRNRGWIKEAFNI